MSSDSFAKMWWVDLTIPKTDSPVAYKRRYVWLTLPNAKILADVITILCTTLFP